ncbi:hypothetical protein A2188_01470 [Candidatus Woesebacteria bacterium RIFOXYA1_FULL_43_9]|uniref:Uncharacterized protein n=1 Tax=Candidatus Woesebacteria bacterium RIFOXYA1_FULL_43_9 TaxID=1802534 RepID=A0A1F8CMV5_9BACT|nr:MAG: hypothetical protein A2188_01470 [Candidatus Woesebacteria bacterium RIFOXYA1_FULL_43_9]
MGYNSVPDGHDGNIEHPRFDCHLQNALDDYFDNTLGWIKRTKLPKKEGRSEYGEKILLNKN